MEQAIIKSLHDDLFGFFNSNCKKVDYIENLAGGNVLIIAVGVKTQITALIAYLNQREEKPSHVYVIIQKNMMPVVQDLENEQCRFIEWEGPYTLDVVGYLAENIDLSTVSRLFYQGRQPLNFRDINLYDILLEIKSKYDNGQGMHIYVQDIQEYVHWYQNPKKVRKGMELYQAIDSYLEE